ncbi:SWIM zinc finger family protein [Paenibacillus sp. MMS20-IR301]|uniref:SWIM zinc finger family protein n=1 Tax=Paenibacillus sp. MMS20-IR301 TaxID=2895946 RepID=UPI0028F09235|nr:SWIM zinc finger family protein [Paenibacillus sp. MMS20-IR301]WNS45669.1 SWIM zinc finger family protein [Paenibacillus sp. MMS20-IR301]
MPELTSSYVDSLAPNAAAMKNGQGLVRKKSFTELHQSDGGELLFGKCAGSGKTPYECSADFITPESPVFRCSCPSRQFPCKHALGLLYAFVEGQTFSPAPVPEDIAGKREKAEKREENKAKAAAEGEPAKPKKVNKSALKKKISAQLEGLDLLEKLVLSFVRSGLSTLDRSAAKTVQEQVKQLGNYYLSGAQIELRRFSILMFSGKDQEQNYTYAVEQLTRLHAFIKKGRAYLLARSEDPELALDHESTIDEWLGHAWQLSELKEYGLVKEGGELLQLAFYSFDDTARQEFVDLGYWLDLTAEGGEIRRTLNYRPYKAAKLMREDDSFFEIAVVPQVYTYPGDMNARIRFEALTPRPVQAADIERAAAQAHRSYADVIKKVKNQIKNPLSDKLPVLLLHAASLGITESGQYVITDESGSQLVLADIPSLPQGTVHLLPFLPANAQMDSYILVMFEHNLDQGRLTAQPLTVIKDDEVIRLLY